MSSDKRVEAAVNRAVKSITDNPADLERELRDFAQTGGDWRQKSMTLEQENEAIRKKLDKVTKELEKVNLKKEAAREIGNFNDTGDHRAILRVKAIVGNGYAHDRDESGGPKDRGLWVRPCVVPCLAGGPSPDILAPISLALPWPGVTSRACSGGS